jgi:S1-C subfamily serine protease
VTGNKIISKGTGSIISKSGLIITNAHVATNEGQKWDNIIVVFKPLQVTGGTQDINNKVLAQLIYADEQLDLAVIQTENPIRDPNVIPLELSDLAQVGIGEPVVAIGHPGGGQLWTMTTGRISASWTDYNGISGWDLFQTETALNPGNSGGPLLAGDGSIVGINTFVIRESKTISLQGLNYAIKSTTVTEWLEWLVLRASEIKNEKLKHDQKPATPSTKANETKKQTTPDTGKLTAENKSKILPPKVKKSKNKFKSELESGVQITESQLMTSFLDNIDKELSGSSSTKKKPSESAPERRDQEENENTDSEGLSNFLESIL